MTVMPYDTMLKPIRGDYLEKPGLRLTMAQAQRLCGVERTLCQRMLGTLVETGFLSVNKDGTYARLRLPSIVWTRRERIAGISKSGHARLRNCDDDGGSGKSSIVRGRRLFTCSKHGIDGDRCASAEGVRLEIESVRA